jgi:hypothetical protein
MSLRRSRLIAALGAVSALAVLALAVVPAPAGARIVPFKSIAGFEPGMRESEVRAKLGEPSATVGMTVGQHTLVYERRKLEFVVFDESGRVGSIVTRSRAHRTRDGLGVGSRLATLKRQLKGERCDALRRYTLCTAKGPEASLYFIVKRTRVTEVWLSANRDP